jgi:hydroxymethylpyrimidine/phosphomethylpyrimidine kinase
MIIKGMLASAATVSLIAKSLRDYNITKSVIDPVRRLSSASIFQWLTHEW